MEIIAAIIGSGIVTTLITLFVTRRNRESEREKTEADTAGAIGDAWLKLLAPMEKRIVALECESESKDKEIKELKKRIEELEAAGLVKDKTIQDQANRIQELESEVVTLKRQLEELGQKPRTKK